jgi:hypothetical protein
LVSLNEDLLQGSCITDENEDLRQPRKDSVEKVGILG